MTKHNFRPHSALWLVVIGVCMVSYSGPMVKGALQAGATPVSVALVRMLCAGVLLLPLELRVCFRRRIPFALSVSQWLWVGLAALFLATHYLSWIQSLAGISTFASVALVCTQPLFVALLSYLLFHETIPRNAMAGAGLALLGAVVIAVSGLLEAPAQAGAHSSAQSLASSLLALLGAVLMAAHWLTARHIRTTVPAQVYTPVLYLLTAILLAGCLPFMGGLVMPLAAMPYMAGLVLGSTLLGHALLSFALSRVSASVVSFALLAEPVGAMVFAMIFFHEQPGPGVLVGGAITLAGLLLYLLRAGRTEAVAGAAEEP